MSGSSSTAFIECIEQDRPDPSAAICRLATRLRLDHKREDAIRTSKQGAGKLPRGEHPRHSTPLIVALGVLLTAVAGFVDVIGYIGLGGLFASFMSGASISLGAGLGDAHWGAVQRSLFMIASFLSGVALGTVLAGVTGAWALPAVLFLEALLLSSAALLGQSGWDFSATVLPVVAAMGVQNTALKPVNRVRLGATFITGTLVSLGQVLGRLLLGRTEPVRPGSYALLWGSLVAGASAGSTLYAALGTRALSAPAVLVGLSALISVVPPLARMRSQAEGLKE